MSTLFWTKASRFVAFVAVILFASAAYGATCTLSSPDTLGSWQQRESERRRQLERGVPSNTNTCITDGVSTVTLDTTGNVASQQVGSGNTLTGTNQTLNVITTSGAGSIINGGLISLTSSALVFNGSGTESLSGGGTLQMSGTNIYTASNDGMTFANSSTITGTGLIGGAGYKFTFDNTGGTVNANVNGGTLTLGSAAGTVINGTGGTLEATNGGS